MPKITIPIQYVLPDHCGNEPKKGKMYIPCIDAKPDTPIEPCKKCIFYLGEQDPDDVLFNPTAQLNYIPRAAPPPIEIKTHWNGAIGCGPQCKECGGNSLTCACEEETPPPIGDMKMPDEIFLEKAEEEDKCESISVGGHRIPKKDEEGGSCEFGHINHEALKD